MTTRPGMTIIETVCVLVILSFAAAMALSMAGAWTAKTAKAPLVARDRAATVGDAEAVVSAFVSIVNDDTIPRDQVLQRVIDRLPASSTAKYVTLSGNDMVDAVGASDTLLVTTDTGRSLPVRNLFTVSRTGPGDAKESY